MTNDQAICPRCGRNKVAWDARCLHYRCLYDDCAFATKELDSMTNETTIWRDDPPSEKNVEFWVQHRRTGKQSIGRSISFKEWLIDGEEEFMPERYFQFGPRVLDAEETADLREKIDRLETQLACCADLVNSWCRESGIAESGSPYDGLRLRDAVDRLWSKLSGRLSDAESALATTGSEVERLERENAELREKLTVDDLDELGRYTSVPFEVVQKFASVPVEKFDQLRAQAAELATIKAARGMAGAEL